MKSPVSFLCTILFAAAAGGATVEVSTEGWTGSGVTNGRKFANLGTDGAMGAGSFIESPPRSCGRRPTMNEPLDRFSRVDPLGDWRINPARIYCLIRNS